MRVNTWLRVCVRVRVRLRVVVCACLHALLPLFHTRIPPSMVSYEGQATIYGDRRWPNNDGLDVVRARANCGPLLSVSWRAAASDQHVERADYGHGDCNGRRLHRDDHAHSAARR